MVAGAEPNAENKLFIGGCPPGSGEEELRKVFEAHGKIEEIFIMRGGSRSGMACAFIRYQTQQMAQLAIDAIHGQVTLPTASEPLVVRWADAPGSRRRDSRDRGGGRRGGHGALGSCRGSGGAMGARPGPPMMMGAGGYGYGHQMHMPMQMQMPMQAMGGSYGQFYAPMGGGYGGAGGGYGGAQGGFMPQNHMQMLTFTQQQHAQAMGQFVPQQPGAAMAGPSPMMMQQHNSSMAVMALQQHQAAQPQQPPQPPHISYQYGGPEASPEGSMQRSPPSPHGNPSNPPRGYHVP